MTPLKLALLATCIFALITSSFAQERTNRPDVTFSKKSEKLLQATGWILGPIDGQWHQNQNILSYDNWVDTPHSSNFYWLQSASFDYNGKKYYAIFYESSSGEYRYPNIMQDWIKYRKVSFFLMDASQYALLKNAVNKKDGKTVIISSIVDMGDNGKGEYKEDDILKKIATVIDGNQKYLHSCFCINSQTLKGQDIVRYRLPGDCNQLDKKDQLKEEYFEVPTAEFKKLLID